MGQSRRVEVLNEKIQQALQDISQGKKVKEITIEDIREMQKALRSLNIGWVDLLAAKLKRPTSYIYNITRGNIIDNATRVEFILKGAELKAKLEADAKKAQETVDNIRNYNFQVRHDLIE